MTNNKNFPPNINPQIFALSATLVGALLVDDYTYAEQSAIGNWLMLVSQYIITHAAEQNLIDSRLAQNNINNTRFKNNQSIQNEIDFLINSIKKIKDELEQIKNER